jgi:hypothetical protein
MTAYYVISAQAPGSSFIGLSPPTSGDIITAFNSVGLYSGAHWVDPSVRIVRISAGALSSGSDTTYATRLLAIDDPTIGSSIPGATNDQAANLVAGEVTVALGNQSTLWSPVVATPFSAAVNGDLSWWQSGQSDVTQTRDQFSGTFSSDVSENPVGPTSAATHPTPGSIPLPTLPQIDTGLMWLVLGGVVILALIYSPEIKGLAGLFPKSPPAPRALPAPKTRSRRSRTTQKGP